MDTKLRQLVGMMIFLGLVTIIALFKRDRKPKPKNNNSGSVLPTTAASAPAPATEKRGAPDTAISMPSEQQQRSGNYDSSEAAGVGHRSSVVVAPQQQPPIYPAYNTHAPYPLVGMTTAPPSYSGTPQGYPGQQNTEAPKVGFKY